ncbi:MAG: NRDE family protein, partial [Proteobacteria bacterium]|nr:NRDE family protein [Pseudomonadota bacterium]
MCTLIVIHRGVPGARLLVAANRDEFLDRPSRGLERERVGATWVVAPRDLRAGGTWQGLSEHGVFAAVTNRRGSPPDPERRSRGELVHAALQHRTAVAAARSLEALPARAYNPFNLFVADGERAFALVYDDVPELRELAPGAHVIGNVDPDDESHPKVARVLEQARKVAGGPPPQALDALAEICREHAGAEPG